MKHATSGIPELNKEPGFLFPAHRSNEQQFRGEVEKVLVRWSVDREMDMGLIIPTFLFKERHLKPSL